MTGLTEAVKSRTPLLLLAAETAALATRSNFRIDQTGLVTSVGALVARVQRPESALGDAAHALERTRDERRPAVLMLPLDIQAAECPASPPPPAAPAPGWPTPSATEIREVADLLAASQRPIFIAGRGAMRAETRDAIEHLAELSGALLATSAVAAGLFAGNRWSVGITGGFASPTAAELIADSHLVISFGASLNMWSTRHGRLLGPGANVVQIDVERDGIGAHVKADASILADAGAGASALAAELEGRDSRRTGRRSNEVARRISRGVWA